MSLIAVFAVAQVAGHLSSGSPRSWDIITLGGYINPGITFTAEQQGDAINATFINSQFDGEIQIVSTFRLAFLYEDSWRIVPFTEDIPLIGLVTLPPEYRINHQITRDMVAVNLRPGNYRLFTQIRWGENVTTASYVWVDFDLE
jgi:hypothetical protein